MSPFGRLFLQFPPTAIPYLPAWVDVDIVMRDHDLAWSMYPQAWAPVRVAFGVRSAGSDPLAHAKARPDAQLAAMVDALVQAAADVGKNTTHQIDSAAAARLDAALVRRTGSLCPDVNATGSDARAHVRTKRGKHAHCAHASEPLQWAFDESQAELSAAAFVAYTGDARTSTRYPLSSQATRPVAAAGAVLEQTRALVSRPSPNADELLAEHISIRLLPTDGCRATSSQERFCGVTIRVQYLGISTSFARAVPTPQLLGLAGDSWVLHPAETVDLCTIDASVAQDSFVARFARNAQSAVCGSHSTARGPVDAVGIMVYGSEAWHARTSMLRQGDEDVDASVPGSYATLSQRIVGNGFHRRLHIDVVVADSVLPARSSSQHKHAGNSATGVQEARAPTPCDLAILMRLPASMYVDLDEIDGMGLDHKLLTPDAYIEVERPRQISSRYEMLHIMPLNLSVDPAKLAQRGHAGVNVHLEIPIHLRYHGAGCAGAQATDAAALHAGAPHASLLHVLWSSLIAPSSSHAAGTCAAPAVAGCYAGAELPRASLILGCATPAGDGHQPSSSFEGRTWVPLPHFDDMDQCTAYMPVGLMDDRAWIAAATTFLALAGSAAILIATWSSKAT